MKTLTIKQPFTSLIIENIKDIENRTWKTNLRGRVLVHAAAKQIDSKDLFSIEKANKIPPDLLEDIENGNLPTGAIIGSVEIVDCVINHPSIWAEKTTPDKCNFRNPCKICVDDCCVDLEKSKPIYNWVLANPIKFPEPIPCKGKLLFWDYPNIISEPEEEDGNYSLTKFRY